MSNWQDSLLIHIYIDPGQLTSYNRRLIKYRCTKWSGNGRGGSTVKYGSGLTNLVTLVKKKIFEELVKTLLGMGIHLNILVLKNWVLTVIFRLGFFSLSRGLRQILRYCKQILQIHRNLMNHINFNNYFVSNNRLIFQQLYLVVQVETRL